MQQAAYYANVSCVDCVFCRRIESGPLLAENELAVAFADAFPLSDGHCLVISRRHEPNFFALTDREQQAVWTLVNSLHQRMASADGFNVGINIGDAGGQTVAHAHVHLIPRYRGDVADPRGGIRWVLPSKAAYWQTK